MSIPKLHPEWFASRRILADRTIRSKLVIAFGVLLVLGIANIGVYYWGARQRDAAWNDVQRAVQRQMIVTDALYQLQDQRKYVDVLTSVVDLREGGPSSEADQQLFAEQIDTVTAELALLSDLTAPPRRGAVAAIHEKAYRLAESWKRFYRLRSTDPSQAIAELYTTAEPLAEELLVRDLPSAVEFERNALAEISEAFVETDRTFSRIAWLSFLLSAVVGISFAVVVSRDVLRKISVLKSGTEVVGRGNFDHRIPILGQDELGDVARSFNDMADRLKRRSDELAARKQQIEIQRDELKSAIEDLKATQAKLVQQEKLASLGALTAGIAHEMKNPLNFVTNFAGLSVELSDDLAEAIENGRDWAEISELLENVKMNASKVLEHGTRADNIVRAMLEHSRGGRGERRPVDLNQLVDEYVGLAYHGKRAQDAELAVTIHKELDEAVGDVEIAPQEIGRVILNLVSNAFDAVSERSKRSDSEYEPQVDISTRRFSDRVEIRVADNGPGISDDVREKIFDPFFTTKASGFGTGLGLSLSHDIVTQGYSGSLTVEPSMSDGATFVVSLPAAEV